MKRRSVLQSILTVPAAATVAIAANPQTDPRAEAVLAETPDTPVVPPVETAGAVRRTFSPEQFATLSKLGDLLVPAWNGYPGASEAGAAEFLDFLLGCSPQPRLDAYRNGLDALNSESQTKFAIPFPALSPEQAHTLLSPLTPFLQTAKSDFLRATFNSRPYIDAVSQTRRPRNASKYFWHPIS